MQRLNGIFPLLVLILSITSPPSTADSNHKFKPTLANSHGPIGIMGDHQHKKGEWMLSYRYMRMDMADSLQGNDEISTREIATTINNPFAGPPTVRVVPITMTTEMHMLGLMYAPMDAVTLMLMTNYIDKEMDHVTFMGMAGDTRLGTFTTESSGIGDTKFSGLIRLFDSKHHHLHANAGLSIPTGSIDEEDTVLTPMNTNPELRLPYAMQLGSGTYDIEPGLTYTGNYNDWSWGAQYMGTFRTGENDEDYTLGDAQQLSVWSGYQLENWISLSIRVTAKTQDSIDGQDPNITAPVQTANPDNYGGDWVFAGFGINIAGQRGPDRGHRVAVEYIQPIEQDVNGVQMKMKDMLILGWQYSF